MPSSLQSKTLSISCWGEGTDQLPASSLCLQAPIHSLLPPTPSPGPALSLQFVPCLELEGMKLEFLDPEEEQCEWEIKLQWLSSRFLGLSF